MASWRDIKRTMRRDLHSIMQIAALYIPETGDPVPVNVRLHYKLDEVGDLKGTNFHYAERENMVPQILFMLDEFADAKRGGVVSIEAGEAYKIDHMELPDDISVKAHVTRLTAAQAVGLPLPEGA